ncbi:cyclin-C-like isoform X2, partial [Dinothrombium tinctorium]
DCCLIVYHPYRPLVQYVQDLKEMRDPKEHNSKESKDDILNISWNVVNDTYRTDIPLLYAPHLISIGTNEFFINVDELTVFLKQIACMQVACVIAQKDYYKQWFAELNVDLDKILEITRQILNLYEMWKNFDDKKEIGPLLAKMPKPKTQPSR